MAESQNGSLIMRSYPKIWNFGHPQIKDIFKGEVVVEEKVDGSQFSFGVFDGELKCKSKNQRLMIDAPPKMFESAVKSAQLISASKLFKKESTYRCEYLEKPKHNVLAYDRVPRNHLIIFDVDKGFQDYMSHAEKESHAHDLGLECVPKLYEGLVESYEDFKNLLKNISILGGQTIEGMVFKNYSMFGNDQKVLMAKFVCEKFKEQHNKDWKKNNPTKKDLIFEIGQALRTEARWEKAIIHLKEAGKLENSPKDIGVLLKEINKDVLEECREEISEKLFKYAWKKISRMIVRGFPEWYKEQLVKEQFENDNS
jgi:tetratricopeptide (TPR) repeat protein